MGKAAKAHQNMQTNTEKPMGQMGHTLVTVHVMISFVDEPYLKSVTVNDPCDTGYHRDRESVTCSTELGRQDVKCKELS